jgi:hypothetical protein
VDSNNCGDRWMPLTSTASRGRASTAKQPLTLIVARPSQHDADASPWFFR